MTAILKGIRVLDLTHVISGPTATQILADLGAEVIKVESPPNGELFRDTPGLGPSCFLTLNRGKKSIMINLKERRGVELLLGLASVSDVFVENLSPEASRKLGLRYQLFKKVNPRIIHCRITSFGEGPYEKVPAWDPVLQAAAGIMSVTGHPPDDYVRAGISLVDMTAAFHAVIGILAALVERERSGKGVFIEASMFDAALYYMGYWITYYDLFKKEPRPLGTTHIFASPYGLFDVGGEKIYIAVSGDEHWKRFCSGFKLNDFLQNRDYSTNELRVKNKERLETALADRLKELSPAYVMRVLRRERIPHAPLNKVSDLSNDPQVLSRGMVRSQHYSRGQLKYRTVVNPLKIGNVRPCARGSPPQPGEQTEDVLRELLGLSDAEISELKALKVVK